MLHVIKLAAPKVEGEFSLYDMVLYKEDIEVLFSECNSRALNILSCTLNLASVPDLSSISESGIEELWLRYNRSDVEPHSDWYELLFQGIAKSEGIRTSLKHIYIKNYRSKEEVRTIKEYIRKIGMDQIKVDIKLI